MINMLTDTAPAAGLSMEGKEDDVMRRPPRPLDEPPITKEKLITILSFGVIMGIVTTIMFGIHSHLGLAHAQTIAFTTLVVMQLFAVMSMRSFEATLTNLNLIENKALLGGIAVSIGLQLIAVYAPPAQALLGTVGLTGNQWLLITGVGLTSFLVFELAKAIVPRRIRTPQ
jgi:Ca2+-transporting ATPase